MAKSHSLLLSKTVQTSISASAHVSIIYNTYHHCLINAAGPRTTQQALAYPIRSLWLLKQEAVAETGWAGGQSARPDVTLVSRMRQIH